MTIFKAFNRHLPWTLLISFRFAFLGQSTMLECFQTFSQAISLTRQLTSRQACTVLWIFSSPPVLSPNWVIPGLGRGDGSVVKILQCRWMTGGVPFKYSPEYLIHSEGYHCSGLSLGKEHLPSSPHIKIHLSQFFGGSTLCFIREVMLPNKFIALDSLGESQLFGFLCLSRS